MRPLFFISILFASSALAQVQSMQNTSERHFDPELTFKTEGSGDWPEERIGPVALPDGRLLLSRFGTVYMLDAQGKQLWKYETDSENESLTSEPAYNAETNEIGIVGYDLLFVRLDAATGKEKWRATTVGGASFIHVAAYGRGFLVVVNMAHYRENARMEHLKYRDPDRLEYWGEAEDDEWIADFPIGARLLVNGKQIYAIWRVRGGVKLSALRPVSKQRQSTN
ncbi:MAG: PQQ-binding-like beta-propeller repeat protein [Terracidiphilus sp.]|jgi:hypothetical protein